MSPLHRILCVFITMSWQGSGWNGQVCGWDSQPWGGGQGGQNVIPCLFRKSLLLESYHPLLASLSRHPPFRDEPRWGTVWLGSSPVLGWYNIFQIKLFSPPPLLISANSSAILRLAFALWHSVSPFVNNQGYYLLTTCISAKHSARH